MAEFEAPADSTSPQPPSFTAVIDQRRGTVRGRGRLDRVGADLLCGTVETLRRRGHQRITLALSGLWTAESAAWQMLVDEVDRQAARGVRLILR